MKKFPRCKNHPWGKQPIMEIVRTYFTEFNTKVYMFKCPECGRQFRKPAINYDDPKDE